MKKHTFRNLTVIAVIALLLTACGGGGGGAKDTLVVAATADPVTLDIQATNDTASSRVAVQIYETLVTQDDKLEIKPGLATEWKQIDDTTYEFKLKKDVKFHNGEPFTAKDVAFTLKRATESEQIGHIVGAVDPAKLKVIDDHTIQVGTKTPFGPFLIHLAHPATGMLNEKAVTEGGEDYGTKPVGTGPFKFVDWVKDSEVNVTRNDEYTGDKAKIENIKFRVIKENSTRLIALETGEIDIAMDVPPADIKKIEDNKELKLTRALALGNGYVGFNVSKDTPLKDEKVRQAINYAIDQQAIIDTVYQGVGKPAVGPLNPLVFGANLDLAKYDYDMNKAKALLAEAGYADGGFTVKLFVGDNNAERLAISQIVKEQLAQLGINVEITQLEWASYLDATGKGDHDMYILGWTTVTGDADYGLFPLFHSSQFGKAGNRSFYKNDEVDTLLEQAQVSTNQEERVELYKKAQEIIHKEVPWIFINDTENVVGLRANVEGFVMPPSGLRSLATLEIKQ